MPAATPGMVDPDGPWRPSTSQRTAKVSSQYYESHPGMKSPNTVRPLQRPIFPTSKHNEESLDRQAAADAAAYARKGNIYWPHVSQHGHHPIMDDRCREESYLGAPPHDRCQAKEDYDYRMGSFNPITGQWTHQPHSPVRASELFLPGSKAGVQTGTEAAYGPDHVGKYDPILHRWIVPPDEDKWQARQRQHQNEVGVHMEGRPGHIHQAQGTYDPITNQWVEAPAGTVAQFAGDRSRQEERDWADAKTARRCSIAANQRLGVYDPILNRWQVPPSHVEEHDEQMRLRAHGLIATKRKVPPSPNVGEYDPIRNAWVVPPQNQRIIAGLTFQPRTRF